MGLFVVQFSVDDQREREQAAFYRDHHFPEVLALDGFRTGQFFRLAPKHSSGVTEPAWTHLALYELDDVDTAAASLAAPNQRTRGPNIDRWSGLYYAPVTTKFVAP